MCNPKELESLFNDVLETVSSHVGTGTGYSPNPSSRRNSSDSGGGKMYSSNAERCKLNREKKKLTMKENETLLKDLQGRNKKLTSLHRMLDDKIKKIKDFYIAAL